MLTLRKLRNIIKAREGSKVKRRDLEKRLKTAGYREDRNYGGHSIYEKQGSRPVQVPNHREIKDVIARRILRDAGIE